MSDEPFDPHYEWLGIAPDEQPANHYRLLGVKLFEAKRVVLENSADRQMTYVRTFQTGPRGKYVQQILNELSAARVVLLDPAKKSAYDARLAESLAPPPAPATALAPAARYPNLKLTVASWLAWFAEARRPRTAGTRAALPRAILVGGGILGLLLAGWILFYVVGGSWSGARRAPQSVPPTSAEIASQTTPAKAEKSNGSPTPPRLSSPVDPTNKSNDGRPASAPVPLPSAPADSPANKSSGSRPASLPVPTPSTPPRSPVNRFSGSQAGEERSDNDLQLKLVWCPPGQFLMGEETATASVTLSQGFWIGKYEVTQEEFSSVMGVRPWSGKSSAKEDARHAASYVSHDDAVEFCRRLTDQERTAGRLADGDRYRLPTEAEWEFACRAGTTTRFGFGDDESELDGYAWWSGNCQSEQYARLVGQKRANRWGLHDMHGNVWEWCSDWEGERLAGGSDPSGPASGADRVSRGNGWDGAAAYCRSAFRFYFAPGHRSPSLGFRVALGSGN